MMRTIVMIVSALVLASSAAFSQGQLDAYKAAQTEINGTARYLGMGGAFGALGGDISAMHTNPAGLAVYRSSEVVTTLSLNMTGAETNWFDTKTKENRTRFNFDNIAYVGYFPTSRDEGIVGWNVGFSYNRVKNFNRKYTARDFGKEDSSVSDYIAERTNLGNYSEQNLEGNRTGYNPYNNVEDWLAVLGYNAFFIDPVSGGGNKYVSNYRYSNGTSIPVDDRELFVSEKGAVDLYNISFGMNISDIIMVGATAAITDINYKYFSQYSEYFEDESHLYLDNWLETEGTGYSFNLGVIARPSDYLRLGVAYTSPTWYDMTDYYYAEGHNSLEELHSTPDDGAHSNYDFRSPDKWLFSVAGVIGQTALISVDYELTNYKNMRMYDEYGKENYYTNSDIKRNFGPGGILRVGAEVKVTPQFAIRAGGAWQVQNPMNEMLENNWEEVATVGTIPHFTTQSSFANYSVGLGYRFTPNFYMDMACVLKTQKENLFAYSNMYNAGGDYVIASTPSTLKTNRTQVALTFGYKF